MRPRRIEGERGKECVKSIKYENILLLSTRTAETLSFVIFIRLLFSNKLGLEERSQIRRFLSGGPGRIIFGVNWEGSELYIRDSKATRRLVVYAEIWR